MASHGGFLGVTLATLFAARQLKVSPLRLGDLIVTVAPPGLLLGRVANFINGELWGKPTEVAWAVIFPHAPFDSRAPAGLRGVARHVGESPSSLATLRRFS